MLVQRGTCDSEECDLECVSACVKVHGPDAPLQLMGNSIFPSIDEDSCTHCLACLRSCPHNKKDGNLHRIIL
jgi:translation initiation factor RLI1